MVEARRAEAAEAAAGWQKNMAEIGFVPADVVPPIVPPPVEIRAETPPARKQSPIARRLSSVTESVTKAINSVRSSALGSPTAKGASPSVTADKVMV